MNAEELKLFGYAIYRHGTGRYLRVITCEEAEFIDNGGYTEGIKCRSSGSRFLYRKYDVRELYYKISSKITLYEK